ncbi:MAG TPA: LON peptidase substrate-binding domain-containing protein [Candidatus Deferrimicrobiaceae bacterium]|nr:LON peptidase substrate-binding domain-containing protein [Candidatus Deferrimicrobiaceae bacterium]
MPALIPLFPLDVVLFPHTPLPLHIFEPRYKEMIAECLEKSRAFGVIRALEQGLAEVGCTAEIVTVVKEYPDGRLDLVAEGRNRFEIVAVNQDRTFLQGEVLMIDDEPGAPPQEDAARAAQLHSELLAIAGAKQDLSAADPALLSFHLAGSLPLDLDFKQKLLSLRSEADRLSILITYLETIIPNLHRAARARERAGGNGHVH